MFEALLKGIPVDGRPRDFWPSLLGNPRISSFSGVKIVDLIDFPFFFFFFFFFERRVIISVGVLFPGEYDDNTSEAEIRDLCMKNARNRLIEFNEKAEFFQYNKK